MERLYIYISMANGQTSFPYENHVIVLKVPEASKGTLRRNWFDKRWHSKKKSHLFSIVQLWHLLSFHFSCFWLRPWFYTVKKVVYFVLQHTLAHCISSWHMDHETGHYKLIGQKAQAGEQRRKLATWTLQRHSINFTTVTKLCLL